MRVAIWGATGHIGRAMYSECVKSGYEVAAYTRSPERAKGLGMDGAALFDGFPRGVYDILINAVAADDITGVSLYENVDLIDWKMVKYAEARPDCLCVSFSSGAVYGGLFESAAGESSAVTYLPNAIDGGQRYGLCKLQCEQRHKAFCEARDARLLDIRIFAFFSRFMDVDKPFFMSDLVKAVLTGEPVITGPGDFYRDFIAPSDLMNLIRICRERNYTGALDAYSLAPASKSEILELFQRKYGLKIVRGAPWTSATGEKYRYCSDRKTAEVLGYAPMFGALQTVEAESDALFAGGDLRWRG
jgi:nucleoside-diphosphate-sugar epimerase